MAAGPGRRRRCPGMAGTGGDGVRDPTTAGEKRPEVVDAFQKPKVERLKENEGEVAGFQFSGGRGTCRRPGCAHGLDRDLLKLILEATGTVVCLNKSYRPTRIPSEFSSKLLQFSSSKAKQADEVI
ncbi:hypothetical protein ACMD2_09953 [Ananas comosus]|uniref:Uncharacterized protein n=1 Tax=Ananas comosus TaxID=4615 RepID=A0A199W9B5_ANACO|nr:hypothetical protein ACMD2_09953 [Ananas comosus]